MQYLRLASEKGKGKGFEPRLGKALKLCTAMQERGNGSLSPKKKLAVVSASIVTVMIVVVVCLASLQPRSRLQSNSELPVASFTYAIIDDAPWTVTFNASESYNPNGSIADCSWSFGDGARGDGVLVTHIYSAHGVYETLLTVTDDEGGKNHISQKLMLDNRPVLDMEVVYEKEYTVVLSAAKSYDSDGGSLTYQWIFWRDGEFPEDNVRIRVAYEVEVTQIFDAAGEYSVYVGVTDDVGLTASTFHFFNIPIGG
jgi:PKD repeat protein